jgi:hypothetical protein
MNIPDHFSESLRILKFFDEDRDRDPDQGLSDPGSGKEKFGSGKNPGSATLMGNLL